MQKLKELLRKLLGKDNTQSGFTLIEVVIVLAIAGLIFVIVFLAVSQAQASRRDTARKSASNQLLAAASSYASNTAGNIPATGWCGNSGGTASAAPATYWTPGNDPSGSAYSCVTTVPAAVPQVRFNAASICGAAGAVAAGSPRQFAVQIWLERAGLVCQDSE